MADAAGWFPQFYAAEGAIADVILKTPEGVTVQTYEEVPFVGTVLNARERLAVNRTYYVATTGSDIANDGLSSGSPFLTVQKAVNAASMLDFNGFTVTIQVAAGTYADRVVVNGVNLGLIDFNSLVIQGDVSTPANVVFSYSGGGNTISALAGAQVTVKGVRFVGGVNTYHISSQQASYIAILNCEFGAGFAHLYARNGGFVGINGNYTVTGSANCHVLTEFSGRVRGASTTVTITGTPAFSTAFASAAGLGNIELIAMTFSGSATGPRYAATLNGVIYTQGGGASYLPGNSAGSTATGGQYA